jgi:pyruvate/2-oxoglutarate dehydrogenase complex dihydrolipoamide dehydrogenase (E3) component
MKTPTTPTTAMTTVARRAVTDGLGLEDAALQIARNGDLVVDSMLRTNNCNVYAAGDVIGAPQLASTGISQVQRLLRLRRLRRSRRSRRLRVDDGGYG